MRYVVKEGDSLYKISKRFYGMGFLWRIIYNRNKITIGVNPNLILEGQVLRIPNNILLKNKFRSG